MNRKTLATALSSITLLALSVGTANAWHVEGKVLCDVNSNGSIDAEDLPLGEFGYPGVKIDNVDTAGGLYPGTTDADGFYLINLPDFPNTYTQTLDPTTLPPDVSYVQPPGAQYDFELTDAVVAVRRNWLVDSAVCHAQACWMTGGGVKFSPVAQMKVAESGPRDSVGGNVYPSCDPNPGDGGQWNHVAHSEKLHFLGKQIQVVRCGNVPGIDPGSESPVTPYNFIEFQGTGTLKGIHGNKVDHGTVYFFARVEDRNEPGSNGAKDGEDIDRYYIHVFSDPGDPVGTTLLILDQDGDPTVVEPVTITGGNLQLHISSCDNPPTP